MSSELGTAASSGHPNPITELPSVGSSSGGIFNPSADPAVTTSSGGFFNPNSNSERKEEQNAVEDSNTCCTSWKLWFDCCCTYTLEFCRTP